MASTPADAGLGKVEGELPNQWLIIGASSLGTVFEWYDFYLYGLVAAVISAQFFSGVSDATGFFFALTAFAAGFAVSHFSRLSAFRDEAALLLLIVVGTMVYAGSILILFGRGWLRSLVRS